MVGFCDVEDDGVPPGNVQFQVLGVLYDSSVKTMFILGQTNVVFVEKFAEHIVDILAPVLLKLEELQYELRKPIVEFKAALIRIV
jgi:hypothetical protein